MFDGIWKDGLKNGVGIYIDSQGKKILEHWENGNKV